MLEEESNININAETKKFFFDLRNNFEKQKTAITVSVLLISISALFLNILSDNIFLKRIQALFLVLSATSIIFLDFSILKNGFMKKTSELYQALLMFLVYLSSLFIFNLGGYLWFNFNDEMNYYIKFLTIPLITILINILYILFLRLIKKIKKGEKIYKETIGWFFIVTLNFHITVSYAINKFDSLNTIKYLFSYNFGSLVILYFFLVSVYIDLFLVNRIILWLGNKNIALIKAFALFFSLIIIALPYIVYYTILYCF